MPPQFGPDYYASRQAWMMVGGIIGAATLHHGYQIISNWYQRRRLIKSYSSGIQMQGKTDKIQSRQLPSAVSASLNNLLHLRTFPLWIYSSSTLAEILITVVYTGVILFLSFYNTYSASKGYLDYANQCGVMAFSQVILIVGLAGKNNILSYLTGISYQKLNYLHRASARVALLLAWTHSMTRVYLGLTRDKLVTFAYVQWGIVALISFTIVFLSSFRFVRNLCYEAFIVLHLIFVLLFLVAAYMHYPLPVGYWVWPAFLLWGLDRIVRFGTYLLNHRMWRIFSGTKFIKTGDCTVELLEGDVMRLTIKDVGLKWKAGQHGYISIPSLSKTPKVPHPFSYANLPNSELHRRDAVFLIKAYNGFTRRLANEFTLDCIISIPAFLEGPYGTPHKLQHNSTVLLIAGGTGITFILSHFLQILHDMQTIGSGSCRTAVRQLHLVWNIRHAAHVSWIAPLINQAFASCVVPAGCTVRIDIHVTRTSASHEPGSDGKIGSTGLNGVLAEGVVHVLEKTIHFDSNNEKNLQTASSSATPSEYGISSRDSEERNKDIEEKEVALSRTSSYGLTPVSRTMVHFVPGRAKISEIIEETGASSAGPMNVTVCGPSELALDARRAISTIATGDRILKGQYPIEFYQETYGW